MTFGEKLTLLRKQANLTQNDLAEKLNVSRQAVTKWENGVGLPDLDNIKKLSFIFNVKIDELLDYKIEEINFELGTAEEKIDKENSKFKNVDNYVLKRFANANSIEKLTYEGEKLTFWQNVFDFFVGAGTLDMGKLLGTGIIYPYLISLNDGDYLELISKGKLVSKILNT